MKIEKLRNPLVFILLFAATVSALTGDVPSLVIIAAIVLMSLILDATQKRLPHSEQQPTWPHMPLAASQSKMTPSRHEIFWRPLQGRCEC